MQLPSLQTRVSNFGHRDTNMGEKFEHPSLTDMKQTHKPCKGTTTF